RLLLEPTLFPYTTLFRSPDTFHPIYPEVRPSGARQDPMCLPCRQALDRSYTPFGPYWPHTLSCYGSGVLHRSVLRCREKHSVSLLKILLDYRCRQLRYPPRPGSVNPSVRSAKSWHPHFPKHTSLTNAYVRFGQCQGYCIQHAKQSDGLLLPCSAWHPSRRSYKEHPDFLIAIP